MKKIFYISILLSSVCFSACEKESSDELKFPVTLYPEKIAQVSPIRLFTDGREIAIDPATAKKIVEKLHIPSIADIQQTAADNAIVFISKDSANISIEIRDPYGIVIDDEIVTFTVKKEGQRFIFYSPLDRTEFIDLPYHKDGTHILKHPEAWHSHPESNVRYPIVNVAYGDYTDMDFCILTYGYYRQNTIVYENGIPELFWVGGSVSNEFNEDFISTIAVNDTLAIQEYRIKYKINIQ
jgi:hypothetical protein